jgi:two-component system, sensor histidine kinase and response regulator
VCKPIDVRELFETIENVLSASPAKSASDAPAKSASDAPAKSASTAPPAASEEDTAPPANDDLVAASRPARSDAPPPFDPAAALSRVGGDEALLKELIGVFIEEYPAWIDELRAAVAARDAPRVRRAAHTVKGAVDSCGAGSAYEAAFRLERMGGEGKLAGAEEALAAIEAEIRRLMPALQRFERVGAVVS